MRKRSPRRWTRGDKTLAWIITGAVVLASAWVAYLSWSPAGPKISIPAEKLPRPNAYDFYAKAGNLVFSKGTTIQSVGLGRGPLTKKAESIAAANLPSLALARSGMRSVYALPAAASDSYISPLVHLMKAFELQSAVDRAHGRWAKAADDCVDAIKVCQDVSQSGGISPSEIGDIDRRDVTRIAGETVNHLTSVECRRLISRLNTIDAEELPFVDVVEQTRIDTQKELLNDLQKPGWRNALYGTGYTRIHNPQTLGLYLKAWTTSRGDVIDHWERVLDAESAQAALAYEPAMRLPPIRDDMFDIGAPYDMFRPARSQCAASRAELRMLTLQLALRAYRLDHCAYPSTLAALTPAYLSTVPTDPFDDKTIRYRPSRGGYVMYSIGPDLVDNGGTPMPPTSQYQPIDDKTHGDIVVSK